jgi:hypothetical protein
MVKWTADADAYADGLDAGWRTGRYELVTEVPACPYTTPVLVEAWERGFADGTEDFIAWQRGDA